VIRRLFWIIVGAGIGLWGRQRAIDAVDQRVPKSVQRKMRRLVWDRIKRFTNDVNDLERKRALERELAQIDERRRPSSRN
jgi:hypothetical protein